MERFVIEGGTPLEGEVRISGAKNAALPLLAAGLLTRGELCLENVPRVKDVATMGALLARLGVRVDRDRDAIRLRADALAGFVAPYDLVGAMRASILVLGPLVARLGVARVSLPGGCAIGKRPVDLHLAALAKMGAIIEETDHYIEARATRLKGAVIDFPTVTVTGTENIMMAATLAAGTTIIKRAAREPEVVDLADCLNAMGARISGHGTDTIRIDGVDRLHGAHHRVCPDRIEAGTWLCAAAITAGRVTVSDLEPSHLTATIEALTRAGVPLQVDGNAICVHPAETIRPIEIETAPYPDFATDMQAQLTALMTRANGEARITETIFENRFMHIAELARMGADIEVTGRTAIVSGGTPLQGARVTATDLRASASLVIAALAAEGTTTIDRIYHLDRGYDDLVGKLGRLGAKIRREDKALDPPANPVALTLVAMS